MNTKQFINSLNLRDGETIRTSCPQCGGRNTFTCTRQLGKVVYNCYKASCGLSGAYLKQRSLQEVTATLRGQVEEKYIPDFKLPEQLVSGKHNTAVQAYAESVHATNADVMYDPDEHRAVFVIRDQHSLEPIGAVGRALNKNMMPKWKRYDRRKDLLYIRTGNGTAVVVEDCASACAVNAAGYTGVAILGTNLSEDMLPKLRQFDSVIIALDKDASKKALKLKKMLDPYTNSKVRFLPDDLKYFSPHQIVQVIGSL